MLRDTRSRAEGDGRSDANQCCDMRADLATIGPEATLKARRCVGPTRARSYLLDGNRRNRRRRIPTDGRRRFSVTPHTNPGFGRWSGHDAGGVTSRPRRCPRSARRRCRLRFRRWPEVVPDPGEVAGHRARVNEDMNRPHAVPPQPLAHAAETVEQATPPCLGPPASPVGLLPACNCIGAPHTRQDDRKACGAKRSRDRRLG